VPLYAAEAELPRSEGHIVDIFLGNQVAPGWFGWVMPTGQGYSQDRYWSSKAPL